MAWHLECGWDVDVFGDLSIRIHEDEDGGGLETIDVTVSTGKYCHTDISGTGTVGSSEYTDFATALKDAADAESSSSGLGLTYNITWDGSNQQYTITVDEANHTLTLEFDAGDAYTRMRKVLGFDGNQSNAASHTSNVTPFFVLVSDVGGPTDCSEDYEPEGLVTVAESRGGSHYSQEQSSGITYLDFGISGEPRNKTMERAAADGTTAGDHPWTFQHFVQHARSTHPFLVVDDRESTVCFCRERGAHFRERSRERMFDQYDGAWVWRFECYVEGRL